MDRNRRKFTRWSFLPFKVRDVNKGEHFGNLIDLSQEGVGMVITSEVGVGTMHRLELRIPDEVYSGENITFVSKTIWCESSFEDRFRAGFKFSSLEDSGKQRLKNMIFYKLLQDKK